MAAHPPLHLSSPESTTRLAEAIAPELGAGDTILLSGPIGAGKTHFARALITARLAAFGRVEDIPSPTFTLVQTYDVGEIEIWHTDLYRLTAPDEVIELGLDEALETAITLIEWPDRLGSELPDRACSITFSIDGDGRNAVISWDDARCAPWLEAFEEGERT